MPSFQDATAALVQIDLQSANQHQCWGGLDHTKRHPGQTTLAIRGNHAHEALAAGHAPHKPTIVSFPAHAGYWIWMIDASPSGHVRVALTKHPGTEGSFGMSTLAKKDSLTPHQYFREPIEVAVREKRHQTVTGEWREIDLGTRQPEAHRNWLLERLRSALQRPKNINTFIGQLCEETGFTNPNSTDNEALFRLECTYAVLYLREKP